ncbi:MAG: translocation/assembly module TamB [Flavobacteriales bacterium]|nr:translocation/assembly module TamB [Flavobacteriales bacterium]
MSIKSVINRRLKIGIYAVAVIVVLMITIILFIRSPWGQAIIVSNVTAYVSNKTNTTFEIEKLYITFSGNIFVEKLFLDDLKGDTLLYSESLEASIAFIPIIFDGNIQMDYLEWDGLQANITRDTNSQFFNYSFLIDAFSTPNDTVSSSSPPPEISIGQLHFTNLALLYNDQQLGIESKLVLKELLFEADEIDLEKLFLDVKELKIESGYLSYIQHPPHLEIADTNESNLLPNLKIAEFAIKKVQINYQSIPDKINTQFSIGKLILDKTDINLNEQIIQSISIELSNSSASLLIPNTEKIDSIDTTSAGVFEWPAWEIGLQQISLSDNSFQMQTDDTTNYNNNNNNNSFDPENINLTAIHLDVNNIQYIPENLTAVVTKLSFEDGSKFKLNQLAFDLTIVSDQIDFTKLNIATLNNEIKGDIHLGFKSFQDLITNPQNTIVEANFPSFSLNPKDLICFVPDLREDTLLNSIAKNNLKGNLKLLGDLNHLKFPSLKITWGDATNINVSGTIDNAMYSKSLGFNLNQFSIQSTQKDILHFVAPDEIGINIPDQLKLRGNASGSMNKLKFKTTLNIPEGEIEVNGEFANKEKLVFDVAFAVRRLEIGKLFDNAELGVATFSVIARGEGKSINTLNAQLSSEIKELQYSNYDYAALELGGNVKDGKGAIAASFKDYNLNAILSSQFTLDSLHPKVDVNLNVIGADLRALKLTGKHLKTAFKAGIHYETNINRIDLHADLSDGELVYNDKSYSLGNIMMLVKSDTNLTTADITSDFLNMDLAANTSYTNLFNVLKDQATYYFTDEKNDLINDSIQMTLNLSLEEAPVITEILAEGVQFDPIQITLNLDQLKDQFRATVNVPIIRYQEYSLDSILFFAEGNKEDLQYSFGFADLSSSSFKIPQTTFSGKRNDSLIFLEYTVVDNLEKLMDVKTEIKTTNGSTIYHIIPEGLIINKNPWNILASNKLQISNNSILAKDFELKRNGHRVKIESTIGQNNEERIELVFDNFSLATITNFFNTEEPIASGILNGNVLIENPTGQIGLLSNLKVVDLHVLGVLLGKLQFDAIAHKNEPYQINVSLAGSNIDLDIKGELDNNNTEEMLDFNLALNRLNIEIFEKFTDLYVSNASGILSSNATLNGSFENPEYNGTIDFKETSFTINELNTAFKLNNESITFTTEEIAFNDFAIRDSLDNLFHLDGKVLTQNILNPGFNLTLKAKEFQVLNSTEEDNELYYGRINLSTALSITGDLNVPVLRGELSINENSNLTYVVPEEELDLMERDGVIVFVNKKKTKTILTRSDENESSSAVIMGYDLNTTLKVNEHVDFKIIVDKHSGDNLEIRGEGDFTLGLDPNGVVSLSGRYKVSDGYYEASLYNLVKRRFDIANGSSIVWRGNPMDAEMDIRAIYKLTTSAANLMAAKTSGQPVGIAGVYNRKLPFWVYLNLDGELLKPEVSFELDMPKERQGDMGGQVYAMVQQINTEEDELNKQVFSLLVLNQFFPTTSSDGARGGSSSFARGNVNKVLEGQLNNFSGKYLEKTGMELDFGLDSYKDYQGNGIHNKTQLDLNAKKKLFDDRLIAQIGSGVTIDENAGSDQQNSLVIENISLEYLITENGKWRIKGFRKNEFESVIDGKLIVTGFSLIFQKEFNQFSELIEELRKDKEKIAKQDK